MKKRIIGRKSVLVVALFLLTASDMMGTAPLVSACTCREPSVYRDYRDDFVTNVFRVKVKKEVVDGRDRWYKVKMGKNFKGCRPRKRNFWIKTAESSATCGALLKVGRTHILFAHRESKRVYSIHSCNPNKQWRDLSKAEKTFLKGREYECNGRRFCADGGSAYLKCSEGCPACDYKKEGITCETSVCRGCGLDAAYLYDSKTFEPAQCKSS